MKWNGSRSSPAPVRVDLSGLTREQVDALAEGGAEVGSGPELPMRPVLSAALSMKADGPSTSNAWSTGVCTSWCSTRRTSC